MCLPKTQRQQGPSFEKRNVWYLSVKRFPSLFLRLLWGVHLLGSKNYLFPISQATRPGYLPSFDFTAGYLRVPTLVLSH